MIALDERRVALAFNDGIRLRLAVLSNDAVQDVPLQGHESFTALTRDSEGNLLLATYQQLWEVDAQDTESQGASLGRDRRHHVSWPLDPSCGQGAGRRVLRGDRRQRGADLALSERTPERPLARSPGGLTNPGGARLPAPRDRHATAVRF